MKRIFLSILSASLLTASTKTPSFTLLSDLSDQHRKNVSERFKRFQGKEGLKRMEKLTASKKITEKEFRQLQRSFRDEQARRMLTDTPFRKRLNREAPDSVQNPSISRRDPDLIGRWEEIGSEEGVFITLNTSVSVPKIEQILGMEAAKGDVEFYGSDGDGELVYMFALRYLGGGVLILSNEPWFENIDDGALVYDLVFLYRDPSIDSPETFRHYMDQVNLRHPTAGFLEVYEWGSDEEGTTIGFGGLRSDGEGEEEMPEIGGGLISLVFDGAGTMTITDSFDPENVDTDSYFVSDDGTVTTGDGDGPSGVVNPDGSVVAFMDHREESEEGMIGIGFTTADAPNEASLQGTYYGVAIYRGSQEILGEEYEHPAVDIFTLTFDGAGNVTGKSLVDEEEDSFEDTYGFNDEGLLKISEAMLAGFLSADSSYGVIGEAVPNEDSRNEVAIMMKVGEEKSAASLQGVFSLGFFFYGAEIEGLDVSVNFGFSTGVVEFDGEGSYTSTSDEGESQTGTYDVSATGVLAVDGDEIGFVGPGDDVIFFAAKAEYEGNAGIGVKRSSGMTDASLTGNFAASYVEARSDGDDDPIYVEDHVTIDFLGVTDSVVNATLIDEIYDEDGELVWVEYRYPPPMSITVNDLSLEGYDQYGNEVHYSFDGNMSYGKTILPSGVPLPLPTLGDSEEDDEGDKALLLEFQANHLGREIEEYTYTDDEGYTHEWNDTTNFVWSASDDTLTVVIEREEWDNETEEEYTDYEKMLLPYSVGNSELTLGGEFEPCDYWAEDYYESWEQCITEDYPVLAITFVFLGEEYIENYYVVSEESFDYKGEIVPPTRASTLPLASSMPLFMHDIEVEGNRLYGAGYAWPDTGYDYYTPYARIMDISDPRNPQELHFKKWKEANDLYWMDLKMKGDVLITNEEEGPNFYSVSGDMISTLSRSYLTFDGTDDYVQTDLSLNTVPYTIACRFKADVNQGERSLVDTDIGGRYGNSIILGYFDGDSTVDVQYHNGWDDSPFGYRTDTWYDVVATFETGVVKLYVNGEYVGSKEFTQKTPDGSTVRFGRHNSGDPQWFDGTMAEVAIWDVALSAQSIQNLQNNVNSVYDVTTRSSLIGYWDFSEGAGTTVNDLSGNGYHGTIYGDALWQHSNTYTAAVKGKVQGLDMALHGNNLYVPDSSGFRIIDVTVPTQPSLVADVDVGAMSTDTWGEVFITDMEATDSYVYFMDYYAGAETDYCTDYNVLRIVSATSPYTEVGQIYLGEDAINFSVHGSFLYTVNCGEFIIYDVSDPTNITEKAKLNDKPYFVWAGEIEKVGNYIYMASGGWFGREEIGVDIIDVTHHTDPVLVATIPVDKYKHDYNEADSTLTVGGFEHPTRSIEVSGGYAYIPQQGHKMDTDGSAIPEMEGSLSVYTTDFAPQPFSLIFPPDGMSIEIEPENAWEDSIIFAWEAAADLEGSSITYHHEVSGDLADFFLISSNMTDNKWTIPLHHVKYYMDQSGIAVANGTWNIWATDGVSNIWSANGPFHLSIDATGLSLKKESLIPDQFTLHPNFPNPFNPTTRIRYDLPQDGAVIMSIYDLTGRKIRELVNRNQRAGFHFTVWDGRNDAGQSVSTGVYIYQIWSGSFVDSRKMLLMK